MDACVADPEPLEPLEGVQHAQAFGDLDLQISDLPGLVSMGDSELRRCFNGRLSMRLYLVLHPLNQNWCACIYT